jgi:integrase/recombinase XerD
MNHHPLEEVIKDYLEEKDISINSLKLYQVILKQWITFLSERKILYAEKPDFIDYLKHLKESYYSTRWIYLQVSVIKGLYTYLSKHHQRLGISKIYQKNLMETIQNIKLNKQENKPILTVEEAKKLILETKTKRRYIWHYRDHAMLYLMLTTGLRSIEVRRAKKKDLMMLNEEMILYVQGKGKTTKESYVKVTKGVKEAINDYLGKRVDQNPYLFISHSKPSKMPYLSRTFFNEMFQRNLRDSGLKYLKITPHALRHTAATLSLQSGGTLNETMQLLRHESMTSTLIYTSHPNLTSDQEVLGLESYILGESKEKP